MAIASAATAEQSIHGQPELQLSGAEPAAAVAVPEPTHPIVATEYSILFPHPDASLRAPPIAAAAAAVYFLGEGRPSELQVPAARGQSRQRESAAGIPRRASTIEWEEAATAALLRPSPPPVQLESAAVHSVPLAGRSGARLLPDAAGQAETNGQGDRGGAGGGGRRAQTAAKEIMDGGMRAERRIQ